MNAPALPPEFGRSLFARLRQNIVDNMPTGSHQARADGWRKLARRCDAAADAHAAVVQQRQETRRIVRSFAPAYRQAALDALASGVKVKIDVFGDLPAGLESFVEPNMSPEDFDALCQAEIQRKQDASNDERLARAAAEQEGKAGFCLSWDEALLKLADLPCTAIPARWPSDDLGDDPDAWYAAEVARAAERGPA